MRYIRWFQPKEIKEINQTKEIKEIKEINQTKKINEQKEHKENEENKENTFLKKRALKQEPHIILAALFAADVKMGLRVF